MSRTCPTVASKGAIIVDVASRVVGNRILDVIVRLRAALAAYTSLWHQRTHGTPADEADLLGAEQAPLLIAAVQGCVTQSALATDFDPEAYLASVEKYLPR